MLLNTALFLSTQRIKHFIEILHPSLDLFINDLEFISLDVQDKSKFPPASGLQWPDVEDIHKLPFDLYPRDHKFSYASPVYADRMPKTLNGIELLFYYGVPCFKAA